jgi:hypothetical protein
MHGSQIRSIDNIALLRALIVVYILCAVWFKVAPDTLSESLRAVERSLDTPRQEALDNAVVMLLYARAVLCILLWLPTRIVAWLFTVDAIAIFGLGLFGLPSFMSPADSFFDGIQAMTIPAIITILFIGGVFGPKRTVSSES